MSRSQQIDRPRMIIEVDNHDQRVAVLVYQGRVETSVEKGFHDVDVAAPSDFVEVDVLWVNHNEDVLRIDGSCTRGSDGKTDPSHIKIQMKQGDTKTKSAPHPLQIVLILGAARSLYHLTPPQRVLSLLTPGNLSRRAFQCVFFTSLPRTIRLA